MSTSKTDILINYLREINSEMIGKKFRKYLPRMVGESCHKWHFCNKNETNEA